jgi:hypothetical protein
MARPLSETSRKVLAQLGKSPKSLDELSARTAIRKDRLAKILWHLLGRGWVATAEEVRRLPVYRRLRDVPAVPRRRPRPQSKPHIAALNAAFGIGLPAKRARGRIVRRSE